MRRMLIAVVCLGIVIPLADGAQGVCTEMVTLEKGQELSAAAADATKVSKAFYMPGKQRVEHSGNHVNIIRLDRRVFYGLDTKEKTYNETTFEEMKAGMQAAGDALAKMRKQLESMPEEQRKMVEQAMKQMPGASQPKSELKVKATGETKKICGYSCQKYVVSDDAKEVLVAWATKDIVEIEAMRKDWEEMTKALALNEAALGGRINEAYLKVGGFPLEHEISGIHMVTTKVERTRIPDDLFDVPAGYTKTKSPMGGMGAALEGKGAQLDKERRLDPKTLTPGAKVEQPAPKVEQPAPAPANAPKFCTGCGAKLAHGARFCTECGKKIGG